MNTDKSFVFNRRSLAAGSFQGVFPHPAKARPRTLAGLVSTRDTKSPKTGKHPRAGRFRPRLRFRPGGPGSAAHYNVYAESPMKRRAFLAASLALRAAPL